MTVTITVDMDGLDCRTATAILAFATTHGGTRLGRDPITTAVTIDLDPATFTHGDIPVRVDDHDPIPVRPRPDYDAIRARAAEAI